MKTIHYIFGVSLHLLFIWGCSREKTTLQLSQTSEKSSLLKSASFDKKYIVMLTNDALIATFDPKTRKEKVQQRAFALLRKYGHTGETGKVFGTLQGFSVNLNAGQASRIAKDSTIKVMGADRIVSLPSNEMIASRKSTYTAQGANYVPEGIKRVGGPCTYTGNNVVWILDTGILLTHPDLNVDVDRACSFIPEESSATDYNAHGTHVAGIVAAIDNNMYTVGVAAGARVVPVKVLDGNGNGTFESVLGGLDYVAANGVEGDVANMSLIASADPLLDSAVEAASVKVKFVLAAGNEALNAAYFSPCRLDGANILTVSAMDKDDNWAPFSNYGFNVDYCAPGVDVLSLYKEVGYWMWSSGTSMAAPHVAGLWLLGKIKHDGTVRNDPDLVSDKIPYIWK